MNADKNDQKKLIRTSYSKDISVDFDNKNITVIGWIVSMRKQGKIYFMMLYDSTGPLQIIIKKGDKAPVLANSNVPAVAEGKLATIPEKIIKEIPFPIPF